MKIIVATLIYLLALNLAGCATVPPEDLERAKSEGIPILITRVHPLSPNSAGGVNVEANLFNASNKRIKYVVLTLKPYNQVGDIAPSTIGGKINARIRKTGPIEPGSYSGGTWGNLWYNHSISCVELTDIRIEYMDGDIDRISGDKLSQALTSRIKESCSVE